MRPGLLRQHGARDADPGGDEELVRLRRHQRHAGYPAGALSAAPTAGTGVDDPLAFEHPLEPPRWLRVATLAVGALSALGIVLAAIDLRASVGPAAAGAFAAAGAAALAAGGLRWRARLARRWRLRVAADGSARLVDSAGPAGEGLPVRPVSWLTTDAAAALTLAVEGGRAAGGAKRLRLLAGPRTPDDEGWRRLRAWLAWRRRGGAPSVDDEAG